MDYESRVNQFRHNAVFTANAVSDGSAALMQAAIGVLSAFPESIGLYLSSMDKMPYGASVALSAALPAISVTCVYTAMQTKQARYWFLFAAQLGISMAIAHSLAATWELWLIPATGIGAWIASASYNASRETREADKLTDFDLAEKAKDNELKRRLREMKAADKSGQNVRTLSGQPDNKTRAHQLSTEGMDSTEIASILNVSGRTVRRYLSENGVTK